MSLLTESKLIVELFPAPEFHIEPQQLMPATGTTQEPTGNLWIDPLLSGLKWSNNYLTFNFPTAADYYPAAYSERSEQNDNFHAASAGQQDAVRWALHEQYAAVADLHFVEVGSNDSAEISVAQTDAISTAWAYYPSAAQSGGDVWFRHAGGKYEAPQWGNYAMHTVLHELGHGLGLKHSHEADNGNDAVMPAPRDSMEFSVMTYRSYVGDAGSSYANETWGYAQSLMMDDIAALQTMYGANFSTNASDTTYTFSTTTGEMSVNGVGYGEPGANRVFRTIWDGGGNDTYDFSNYATDLNVRLAPGSWSLLSADQLADLGDGNFARGNVFNALLYNDDPRSLIENAVGGSGNDTIRGNQANNMLAGNGGWDVLFGDDGNDFLAGGGGRDTLSGGAGFDVLAGGRSHDRLYGGLGNDQFVFAPGDGSDVVYDFKAGGVEDWINLRASGLDTFEQIRAAATDVGANCVIQIDAVTKVTLVGVHEAKLTMADFGFDLRPLEPGISVLDNGHLRGFDLGISVLG